MIPIINSKRQYETIGPDVEKAVLEVLRSGSYILGKNNQALQEELAKYIINSHWGFFRVNGKFVQSDHKDGKKIFAQEDSYFVVCLTKNRIKTVAYDIKASPGNCYLDEFEIVSTNVFENSVVNVKYDPDSDKYLVTKIRDLTVRNDNTIQPFYSKIVDSSINKADNTLSVTEKIFFTRIDYDDNNNVKLIRIYKDCLDQNLIAEINNNTGNQIEEFNMENYLDKAMTVTYTFKLSDDGNYYFDNSKIEE